jgi:hypothetical protein
MKTRRLMCIVCCRDCIGPTCKVHHRVMHFRYGVLDPAKTGQALAGLALEFDLPEPAPIHRGALYLTNMLAQMAHPPKADKL